MLIYNDISTSYIAYRNINLAILNWFNNKINCIFSTKSTVIVLSKLKRKLIVANLTLNFYNFF